MSYKRSLDVGGFNTIVDPATICVFGTGFTSGLASHDQSSPECQVYLANRCAKNWDGLCEYAANPYRNQYRTYAADSLGQGMRSPGSMTQHEVLLRNTAMEKYRIRMHGVGCSLKTEQFNPVDPASPHMSRYIGTCIPEFSVDPETIDVDPVMNHILESNNIKPYYQLLVNIRNTMKRDGTFHKLAGTKLGLLYGLS
jgi:hypothetical protein